MTTSPVLTVMHETDLRQIIFNYKYDLIYGKINPIHDKVVAKYKKRTKPYDNVEQQLHTADLFNWRETAIILGLYYIFNH
jgi:hypothetical protein